MFVEIQKSLEELHNKNISGTINTKFSGTTQHKC